METISRKQSSVSQDTRLFNDVFLYVKDGVYIKLTKVFLLPDSDNVYVGHVKIWEENAPFYFVFKSCDLYTLNIKGHKNSKFLPNMFRLKTDKKGKKFLTCVIDRADAEVKYYGITNTVDLEKVKKLKNLYPDTFIGMSKTDPTLGEAFQIIKRN
jgi:hypothetical protein